MCKEIEAKRYLGDYSYYAVRNEGSLLNLAVFMWLEPVTDDVVLRIFVKGGGTDVQKTVVRLHSEDLSDGNRSDAQAALDAGKVFHKLKYQK